MFTGRWERGVPRAPARARWPGGVAAGRRARVRGLQRRGQPVPGGAGEAMAEGEGAGLDHRGGPMAAADQRGALAEPLRHRASVSQSKIFDEAAHALGVDIRSEETSPMRAYVLALGRTR